MEIIKKEQALTLINELNEAEKTIFMAHAPKELASSVITLSKTKDAIKQANKIIADSIAPAKALIKEISTKFKSVEEDLKGKVKDTYKQETVIKQYHDEETGEVTFKKFVNNNLGKNMFSWTPGADRTDEIIDFKTMLENHEKYKAFIEEEKIYRIKSDINGIPIDAAKEMGLPITTRRTQEAPKVGIQWVQIKKKISEQIEDKKKVEAMKGAKHEN